MRLVSGIRRIKFSLCCSALAGLQLLACSVAHGAIPHALRSTLAKNFFFKPILNDFSKGFDIAAIQPVESARDLQQADIAKVIPYQDMHATNNEGLVAAQILDRSLSTWFNSDAVRNSDMGRTAHSVEKSMESDVSFGGSQPESIKHQVKFLMRASQTQAELEYSGLTNAQVTYSVMAARTNIELREPMHAMNTELVYNHILTRDDRKQMVSFRWIW